MKGRNQCFANAKELITCLHTLTDADRRMKLLNAHFGQCDLSALVAQDPALNQSNPNLFIQILLCLKVKDQITWLQQESDWVKENLGSPQQFVSMLIRFSPSVWPATFAFISPCQFNRQTFDILLQRDAGNAAKNDDNNEVLKSIRSTLPDILTYADLHATMQVLHANGIYQVSSLLDQFHHLIQSFDEFSQIFKMIRASNLEKELFKHLGKELFVRELKSVDRVNVAMPIVCPFCRRAGRTSLFSLLINIVDRDENKKNKFNYC